MQLPQNLLDDLLLREGGYTSNPADKGGETKYGITVAVARANGYTEPMSQLSRDRAGRIYTNLYWERPQFNLLGDISPKIAAELFDTGVNMGPATAGTFLQRALNALNRQQKDYPDLVPDGRCGAVTRVALSKYLTVRKPLGEAVMLKALNCMQGERYLRLAEGHPDNEAFIFGWLANRIGEAA